ncbi:hypothetical protein ZIOFF_046216 [Zingiber officinale]|uniref:Phospholipid/glycerol acyltransferase domain-containing protein n=1 Tax=Zingiber officinale TaxID=94328 RepID=A0A8J5G9C4_ZINOF|nr:hypothetical protein ZIOFF_046216 [Zingiber officinale]
MAELNGELTAPLIDSEVAIDVDGVLDRGTDAAPDENPYAFLGAPDLVLPPKSPIDPFRNHTPRSLGRTSGARRSYAYQWINRKGRPAPREIAPIVVCNHISYIEPIFFFFELIPTMVASESHDALPFVGTIIRAMQRKASSNEFPRVMLFPEGTTTNGRFLLSLRPGAFLPGLPVQPVVVCPWSYESWVSYSYKGNIRAIHKELCILSNAGYSNEMLFVTLLVRLL